MTEKLPVAIVGLGRMGWVHATHLWRLEQEGACRVAALVDIDTEKARRFAARSGCQAKVMGSVEELAASGICQSTMIVTPTDKHREHAAMLVKAGHRVLLEKPLTGSLAGDANATSEARQQAASCPGATSASAGSRAQMSARQAQRGAKRQPAGGEARFGGSPSIVSNRALRGWSSRGTARSSPIV